MKHKKGSKENEGRQEKKTGGQAEGNSNERYKANIVFLSLKPSQNCLSPS